MSTNSSPIVGLYIQEQQHKIADDLYKNDMKYNEHTK